MTEVFYGDWLVQVTHRDAMFGQRFVVSGADFGDGAYDGLVGVNATVAGARWTLDLEWNDNVASGWQPSGIRRSARYTLAEGLAVVLGADDNEEAVRDHDYDDLVITCISLDPSVNPPATDPRPDFTYTRRQDG